MPNTTDLYVLTTLSNLHVGRGDSNYGIVDNEVQRDPTTNYPAIFASSLKGALREAFRKNDSIPDSDVIDIFGSKVDEQEKLHPGSHIFYQGHLLSLPVRGEAHPFYHGVSPTLLSDLQELLETLLPQKDTLINRVTAARTEAGKVSTVQGPGNEAIDEFMATRMSNDLDETFARLAESRLLPRPFALLPDKQFGQVVDRLPVIARNQLKKGISKNLFYEEVVPRQSRFYFFVERPQGDDTLHEFLTDKNMLNNRLQLGANATVGYGVCRVKRVASTQENSAA